MQRVRGLATWLAIMAGLFGSAIHSRAQSGVLVGYTRHLWEASDGLPEQTVQAFAQTQDGYLWIGTSGGLVRFDGSHFTVYERQNTPSLRENSVFCLMVSRDGALWIGTEGGGLARYAGGVFRLWSTRDGLSNDFVRTLTEDAQGRIWAGTDNGLLRLDGDRFVRIDDTPRIPALAVHAIYQDRKGNLWVGGSKLLCIAGNSVTEYALRGEPSENRVKSITQTRDGTIWVGTVSGLNQKAVGARRFVPVNGITGTVRALRQTGDGALWIGMIGRGVFKLASGKLSQVTAPASLPSNTVLTFFEDDEKNFWIGTQAGMMRLTKSQLSIVPLPKANDSDFETIYRDHDGSFWIGSTLLFHMNNGELTPTVLPGLAGVHVRNVFRDRNGVLWVGTDGDGVFRIQGNDARHFTTSDGLSNNFVRAITQDHDGSIWINTDEGLNHVLESGKKTRIIMYQMRDGLAYFSTRDLLEDRNGDLWVGTDRGVSHMHAGRFVSDAATVALEQMKVWSIHEDTDGSLWFGTRNNGLFRFRDGKMAHFSASDGLAGNAIYQILGDNAGRLWISGPNGISLLNRYELDAQAYSFPRHLALTFYSTASIAANVEIYGDTKSSGCIAPSGDVWFPSNLGPIHISPSQRPPLAPPPLQIQRVLADGRPIDLKGPAKLRPGNSRLEFSFAPIRLSSQDELRFRSRLEGFDKDWNPTTAARTADYTNLPAGGYRFRVQTFELSNPDAVTETSIAIEQRPFFYRTWWFIELCAVIVGLVILLIYKYRVQQVRMRFEAVLEERNRLAREMHDTVIQGCTGVSALLEAASMNVAKEDVSSGLMDFARLQLGTTINEAREAIWNLRKTSDAASLGEKLESMTREVGNEFQIPVECSIDGSPFTVTEPVAHDLLMVAREAVYNSMLHGHPTRVSVALIYQRRELMLALNDDGCGFSPRQIENGNGRHFGLKGMRERVERSGGNFHLISSPGSGVQIEVRLPRRK